MYSQGAEQAGWESGDGQFLRGNIRGKEGFFCQAQVRRFLPQAGRGEPGVVEDDGPSQIWRMGGLWLKLGDAQKYPGLGTSWPR